MEGEEEESESVLIPKTAFRIEGLLPFPGLLDGSVGGREWGGVFLLDGYGRLVLLLFEDRLLLIEGGVGGVRVHFRNLFDHLSKAF